MNVGRCIISQVTRQGDAMSLHRNQKLKKFTQNMLYSQLISAIQNAIKLTYSDKTI